MNKSVQLLIVVFAISAIATFSCKEKQPTPDPTEKLNFFLSIDDAAKQVAFSAMINYGDVFLWDFGDGQTSNEKNPVHVYAEGGTYDVKLSVTGKGQTKEITKEVSVALTNMLMLAGDNSRFPNGKKWRMSVSHSSTDKFAESDANFTTVTTLAEGILGMGLGLSEVYEDEYLFKSDGTYQQLPKHGGAFASTLYAMATTGGASIIKVASEKEYEFLCYAAYNPETDATYTFIPEKYDFTIATAYGPMTYKDVMTLDFSGAAFIGFMDHTRKCIVRNLTPTSMQLVLFASLEPTGATTLPTHAMWITFEVVR